MRHRCVRAELPTCAHLPFSNVQSPSSTTADPQATAEMCEEEQHTDAFERACALVREGKAPLAALSTSDKLRLYGLYAFSTRGHPSLHAAPSLLAAPSATAKRAAWESAAEQVSDASEARLAYIALVEELSDTSRLKQAEKDAHTTSDTALFGSKTPTGFVISDDNNENSTQSQDEQHAVPNSSQPESQPQKLDISHWAAVGDARSVAYVLSKATEASKKSELANFLDEQGLTPLMRAADRGHVHVVHVLLSAGAAVNTQDPDGLSALHYAALCGHALVARRLIYAGADLNMEDYTECTPMDVASDEQVKSAMQSAKKWHDFKATLYHSRLVHAALAAGAVATFAFFVAKWRRNFDAAP